MTGRTYRRRFLLLGGVCLLLLLGSMLVGRYSLSAGKLLHMLWTRLTGGAADWSVSDEKVVFAIRLPRIAAAALVGAALAVSGTAYQGMFRNPMVSPDILGPPPAQASAQRWLSCWGPGISASPCPPSASVCWPWQRRGW